MLSTLKPKFIVAIVLLVIFVVVLAIVPRHQVVMDCKRPAAAMYSLSPSKSKLPYTYRFTETLLGLKYVDERSFYIDSRWKKFCDDNYDHRFLKGYGEKIKVGDLYAKCSWRDKGNERDRSAETELNFFNKKLNFYYWENAESWTDLDDSEFTQEYTKCSVRDEYHLRVFY